MNIVKNKKIRILCTLAYLIAILLVSLFLCRVQYRTYLQNYNKRLNQLCLLLSEKTDMTPAEIMDVLDKEPQAGEDFFAKFGIDLEKDSALASSRAAYNHFTICLSLIALLLAMLPVIYGYLAGKQGEEHIKTITRELEGINNGDYNYDMNTQSEGNISILENEIYKTAITLKEAAENSQKDKESLKDSLSDISHQLKTPLTSLSINLDNLEAFPDLPEEKKSAILKNAKRDVNKVNQMVQLLLKLSRFEANAIEYDRKPTPVNQLIKSAVENVEALCDLKGIEIEGIEGGNDNCFLLCDAYWETEAITNILKNGIEHAASKVRISFTNYELYSEIVIENDGEPISDEAARNAFNRFYRGENAAEDSVGIGLALASAIVNQDGGYILAEAGDKGTRFILRFLP